MTNRMVGSVLTLVTLLFSAGAVVAQTYTQMQWGMNKGATPYTFGANINGTWRDLGTVTAGGVWSIPSSNISFTPAGTGAVTTTVQDKLRQTVSVIDFGADPTGVADSAPAFRNAIKSDRNIIIPPGTYTLRTTQSLSGYCSLNLVCAINDPAVLIQDQSNFSISGYGATINVASNIAYSAAFLFLKTNNYVVEGFELNGSRAGMLPTQQNAGFALMSNVDWTIRNINFASGFDDLGSPFVGDWLVNGHIINNRLTNPGQCADFGYSWNLNIVENYSVGASSSGTQTGPKCWSFINDPLNINTNNTGYPITQNENINLVNNYVTNFNSGAFIAAGKKYFLSGNTWDANLGATPGVKGNGVFIYYSPSGAFPSVGFPPQDITISGDRFTNNGSVVAGAGVLIDPSNITNSDEIKNITIVNSRFDNNANTAIWTTATAHASSFYTAGNIYSGVAQTTNIDSNTWALNTQFTGDNGGKYVTSSNPIFQITNGGSDGGVEFDNYSATNKWKWNVSNASGNFYLLDKTNTKFPFIVNPNINTTLTLASTGANVSNSVTIGAAAGVTGALGLSGTTSGTVTIKPQDAAGTYNFNLPTTAGTSSYLLTSAGGGTSPMTWTSPTTTINGTSCTLGSTCTVAATSVFPETVSGTVTSGGVPYFNSTTQMSSSALLAQYQLVVGGGAGAAPATLGATGSAGQVLRSGGAAANPSWSTATFPSTATSAGTILRADGTNWAASTATYPNTTAAGTLLTSATANAVTASATPTLGVAGSTVGSLSFANATSGSVTLQPTTGALGSAVATLPANTGTIAELNLAQTFTATQTVPLLYTTNTNAGSDAVIVQTNQPATSVWQQNVSNSNGSWYMWDSTNGKFPLVLGFNSTSALTVNSNGVNSSTRFIVTANLPTISACGTTPPAATAGSSNNAGQFTLGTGTPTACTVTFNSAYPTYAYCTVSPASNYTGTYYISAQSRTAFTVTLGTGTSSAVFNYTCFGN